MTGAVRSEARVRHWTNETLKLFDGHEAESSNEIYSIFFNRAETSTTQHNKLDEIRPVIENTAPLKPKNVTGFSAEINYSACHSYGIRGK